MLLVLGDIILFTFRIIFTLLKFIIKAIVKTLTFILTKPFFIFLPENKVETSIWPLCHLWRCIYNLSKFSTGSTKKKESSHNSTRPSKKALIWEVIWVSSPRVSPLYNWVLKTLSLLNAEKAPAKVNIVLVFDWNPLPIKKASLYSNNSHFWNTFLIPILVFSISL